MLHTQFYGNGLLVPEKKRLERVFTIYGHGSRLGHVTSIILIYYHFHVLKSLHTKFG